MPVDGVGAGAAVKSAEEGRIETWEDLPGWAQESLMQAQFIGIKVLTDEQVNRAFNSTQGN